MAVGLCHFQMRLNDSRVAWTLSFARSCRLDVQSQSRAALNLGQSQLSLVQRRLGKSIVFIAANKVISLPFFRRDSLSALFLKRCPRLRPLLILTVELWLFVRCSEPDDSLLQSL